MTVFEVPASLADAKTALSGKAAYVSGKKAIFYSGPIDENGNSTGENLRLAKECAELYPDDYYTISNTEAGEYLDFLFDLYSKNALPAEFDATAMSQLGTQGSQQYSASAVGGSAIVFSDGTLRPGNDFYRELEVQFSGQGQLNELNGMNIDRLKNFTNGDVEKAAKLLGAVSDCYPPNSPTPGGAALPNPATVDETWKVGVVLGGIIWGWALAAQGATTSAAGTVVTTAGKVADLFVKTAAAILPFGILQGNQKAEAAGAMTNVATQMQVRSMVAKGDLPPQALNELPPLQSFTTLSGQVTFTASEATSNSVAGGTIVRKDENGNVQSVTTFNVDAHGHETSTVATFDPATGALAGTVTYQGSGADPLTMTSGTTLNNNQNSAPNGTTVGPNQYFVYKQTTIQDIAKLVGTSAAGILNANPGMNSNTVLNPGMIINMPLPNNGASPDIFTAPSRSGYRVGLYEWAPTDNVNAGFGEINSTHYTQFTDDTLDRTDMFSTIRGSMVTGGVRPGNFNLDPFALNTGLLGAGELDPDLFGLGDNSILNHSFVGSMSGWNLSNGYYIDPLLLDLTGNGIGTTSYKDDPVLFDMDNSGTLKRTSWVNEQAGILVVPDSNGNVTNTSQLFSEYYKGTTGANGNAGSMPFVNGFDALGSEDSNHDGAITSSDNIWNQLRVWVDADHDAKVDTGELKTLSQLGITRINTGNFMGQGTNNGNPITATSTFIMNGVTRTLSDINLISDGASHTFTNQGTGVLDTTVSKDKQGVSKTVKTYGENSSANTTLNAATLNVDNVYGGNGNDTLIAKSSGSWLVGGGGSNIYQGGTGNDVFVISASDDPANVHGNGGNDIAMVAGTAGMTLNMAQMEVTIAEGGAGDDVIMSGGRTGVYIQGGSGGQDLLIGGAGNDVITGGSGKNTIIGGTGQAIIYAGPNGDLIYGAKGDSIINAGKGADTIVAGAGNDIIKVGMGNATIDGGAGTNIVQFHGSYGDYKITKVDNGYWIADMVPNRDGTVFIENVQKLNFVDIQAIDIESVFAMPVRDTLSKDSSGTTLTRTQSHLISAAQLLANDQTLNSTGPLQISSVSSAIGGTVSLTQAGDVLFTPDATFTGIMSFKYTVVDAQGHSAMNVEDEITGQNAIMNAKVTLATPDVPSDPLAAQEWYLGDVNVLPVWKDYTGKGVRIGQFEPGGPFAVDPEILNYNHPDLAPNIDIPWYTNQQVAGTLPINFSNHATMVAGIMAAARNGSGAVGIAYDAKLAGEYYDDTVLSLGNLAFYDVANNSWSAVPNFGVSNLDPNTSESTGDYVLANAQYAAYNGRGGKGTVIVTSAGNGREEQESAQGSITNNNRFSIQVGGINGQGDISTLDPVSTPFSSAGASLLVSAPASNIASTGQLVMTSQGSIYGDSTQTMNGTSFATPIVSGIVALMLEANPNLGYRDVQEILALSAKKINDPNTSWTTNSSTRWNGGGMHTSHDYGFGEVDALAAVRLAETWLGQKTGSNESMLSNSTTSVMTITAGNTNSSSLTIASGLQVEHVEVDLDLAYGHLSDVTVKLISPTGTQSILLGNNVPDNTSTSMKYTFMSTRDWGEKSNGTWTLQVTDKATGAPITVNGWALRVYGSPITANDTYFYTNEYAAQVASNSARATLNDATNGTSGGINTINTAAVTGNTSINLSTGSANLAGTGLTIQNPTNFNNIFTGDGNDTLTANNNKGILDGGRGVNTLTGGTGKNIFVIHQRDNGQDTINNFTVAQGDSIDLVGFTNKNFSNLTLTQQGSDVAIGGLGNGQSILVKNITVSALTASQFAFQNMFVAPEGFINSANSNDTLVTGVGTIEMNGGFNSTVVTTTSGGKLSYSLSGTVYRHDQATSDKFVVNDFNNAVQGFKPGIDKIDLSGTVISDPSYLTLKPKAYVVLNDVPMVQGVEVTVFDGTQDLVLVYLDSILPTQLKASDFIFTNGVVGDPNTPLAVDRPVTPIKNVPLDTNGSENPFLIGSSSGITTTQDGNGVVTVQSSVNYVLPNTINNLTLTGTANLVGTGNNNANTLISNSGINTLIGGLGNDIYILNDTDDVIVENSASGTDTVQSSASYALSANVENLILTGTADINGIGNALNNVITGNSGANVLKGGAGNDTLNGGLGNDTYQYEGDYGTDSIGDTGGTDTLDFTLFDSNVNISLANTSTSNGTGNSVTWSANTLENLATGSGNDVLTGNSLANVLSGNDGNDTLTGGSGNDTLDGGLGNDTYIFSNGWGVDSIVDAAGIDGVDLSSVTMALTVNMAASSGNDVSDGTNTITWTGNIIENISTGSGNDTVNGTSDANVINAGAGNDAIWGAMGNDTLNGNTGNDRYVYNGAWGNDSILDADGVDLMDFRTSALNVTMNLAAGTGDEVTDGTSTINWSGNIIENAQGGSGNDSITGNSDANSLVGNAGDDTITGGAGNDITDGGSGNDTFRFANGMGTDIVTDSAGIDTLDFGSFTTDMTISLANTTFTESAGNSVTWTANVIENLITGSGNDSLTGNSGANLLNGGAGNDILSGGLGDDVYQFNPNYGTDSLNDASGSDTLDFSLFNTNVSVSLAANSVTGSPGNAINWTPDTIENLTTGSGDDTLNGNSGTNVLSGGSGNDTLIGLAGNDTLDGGTGDDAYLFANGFGVDSMIDAGGIDTLDFSLLTGTLTYNATTGSATAGSSSLSFAPGSSFIEKVIGGSGNDSLTGTSIDETFVGGAGNDTLTAGSGNDVYVFANGFGNDSVNDSAGVDTLDFSAVTAALNYSAATGTATVGTNTVTYNTANTVIERVFGGSAADTMTGGSASETLSGGVGNDTMDGGAGNDTYTFANGWGNDSINDASGIDTADLSAVTTALNVNMASGAGNEVSDGTNIVNWTGVIENLLTGLGNDTINGTSGDNFISMGAGNDAVWAAGGNDTLDGGSGNDRYVYTGAWGNDSILDSAGIDQLDFGTSTLNVTFNLAAGAGNEVTDGTSTINWSGDIVENVKAGSGNDSITGNSLANSLIGGTGNDTLNGGAGNDTLDGGAGDDVYQFALGYGTDTVTDVSGTDTLDFSAYSEDLGLGLNTTTFNDGNGNIVNWSASAIENLIMGSGNDFLTGNSAANVLTGGAGNDNLVGLTGNDTLDGGAGNDTYQFANGFGTDLIMDASGSDTLDFSQVTATVTYDATTGSAITGASTVSFNVANTTIEKVMGGTAGDSLTGGGGNDYFTGNAGNDTMDGAGGNDQYLYANGWGSDSITDAAGIDTVDLSAVTTALNVNMTSGAGNEVSDGTNLINWTGVIENIITGSASDTINGTSGDNFISTGVGNDGVWAAGGNDTIDGGIGNDRYVYTGAWGNDSLIDAAGTDTLDFRNSTLNVTFNLLAGASQEVTDGTSTINWSGDIIENVQGGLGNDSITGNSAANTLSGGKGNDTLMGGTGNDNYLFAKGDGVDRVSDFDTTLGNLDEITFDSTVSQSTIAIFKTTGGDLQIGYTNSAGDLITIQNQFNGGNTIERFELSTGQFMTDADMNQIIAQMSSYATSHGMSVTSLNDVKNDTNLMAIVNGGWHS